MRISNGILGTICACAIMAQGATAQDVSTNAVAQKTDWVVFVADNPVQCWAASAPTDTVATRGGQVRSVNRGEIQLTVSFSPPENAVGQVSFTGGYPFQDGSDVTVEIGGSEFKFFTSNNEDGDGWAWPVDPSDDALVVDAMKRGVNAVVTGLSSRGTTTKDTFSLLGFTAALEEAEKRCTS